MRFIIATILLSYSVLATCQTYPERPNAYSADSLRIGEWITFYDSLGNEINRGDLNISHYCLMEINRGKPFGQIECFYENGIRSWTGRMLSIDPEIKQGRALGYHKNGVLWSKGFYENDTLQGPFTSYHPNGVLESEGEMIDGKRVGKWTFFYENANPIGTIGHVDGKEDGDITIYYDNGNINSKGTIKNSLSQGYWEVYFENGELANKGTYVDGKREGKWIYYFENGQENEVGYYKNDIANGDCSYYYENGKLKSKGPYKDGIEHGYWEYYHENGQLNANGEIEKGLYQGKWTFYFPNGQKKSEGVYIDDKNEGLWRYFYENGQPNRDVNYRNGLENGTITYYYDNGVLNATGEYKDGEKDGKWLYQYSDGSLQGIENYQNGILNGHKELKTQEGHFVNQGTYLNGEQHGEWRFYDGNGAISSIETYSQGSSEGPIISYFGNGNKSKEGQYKNNLRDGEWIYYHSNGQFSAVGEYKEGNSIGVWKYYYDNGALKKEGEEFADESLGEWVFYNKDGMLSSRGSYKDGLLHGPHLYYDSLGNVSSETMYINGVGQTFNNLYDSVDNLSSAGKFDLAEQTLLSAEKAYYDEFEKNALKKSDLYELMAVLYRRKGDYKKSIKFINKSLKNTLKFKDDSSSWYTSTLDDLADTYFFMEDYQKAYEMYKETADKIALRPNGKQSSQYARTFRYQTIALMNLKKHDEAIQLLEQDIAYRMTLPNQNINIAAAHYSILDAHYPNLSPAFDSAIVRSIQFHQENDMEHHWTYATTLYFQALISRDKNQIKEAVGHFTDFVQISKSNGDTIDVDYVNGLIHIGNYHYNLLQYDVSRPYYNQAFNLAQNPRLRNTWVYASALKAISNQSWADDKIENTLKYNNLLIEESKKDGNISREGQGYNGVALAYEYMGEEFDKLAEENHQKAIETLSQLEGYDQHYLNANLHYANYLSSKDQYKEEYELLNQIRAFKAQYPDEDSLNTYRLFYHIAYNAYNRYQYDSAIHYSQKIINDLKNGPGACLQQYIESYRLLGDIMSSKSDHEAASVHYLNALSETEKYLGKENELYYYCLLEIAQNFSNQNNPTSAILYFKQAIDLIESIRDNQASLTSKIDLAEELNTKEEYEEAIELLTEVKKSFEYNGNTASYDYLWCLRVTSSVHENKGDLKKAESILLDMVSHAEKMYDPDSEDYASFIRRVGEFYSRNNEPEIAYQYVAPAFDIVTKKHGDNSLIYAWYAETMSEILFQLDDYALAVNLLEKAANIYLSQVGENKDYMDVQYTLGQLFVQLGQFENSLEALEKKRAAAKSIYGRFSFSYMLSSRQIARTYLFWKKPEEAYKELVVAKNLSDSLGIDRSYYGPLYNFMGWALQDMDKLEEGKKHYHMAIAIADSVWGKDSNSARVFRSNLAFYHLKIGDFEAAEKLWLETEEEEFISDLSNINWLDNMAMLYTSWGKLDQAEYYWDAVNDLLLNAIKADFPLLSEQGKAAFWDNYKDDFEIFNTYAIAAHKTGNKKAMGQMFDNQLQTKSLLLNSTTRERKRILNSGNEQLLAIYKKYLQLKEDLAKYYGYSEKELQEKSIDIPALENKAESLEKALSINSEEQRKARNEQNLNWKSIQRSLLSDEAAIEIIRFRHFDRKKSDSVIYAALILTSETNDSPIIEVLPNGDFLEGRAIKAYRSAMKYKVQDKRSYKAFWSAIDQHLNGISKVYLSSDGVYHQLNVATLQREDQSFINEHYDIRLVSSTRTISELKKKTRSDHSQTAYIFGNPKFDLSHTAIESELKERGLTESRAYTRATTLDDFSFSELPGTKVETETVNDVLTNNDWTTNLYLGENALEEELKRVNNPGILHIATHGFFLDQPDENKNEIQLGVQADASRKNALLRSGLLMTGATQTAKGEQNRSIENGIFTAYEAMNLDLSSTELVILSACETGLGEIKNGEGVFGLQRAFQIAGAKSILMSLWKVDDAATQLLMTSFYKSWLNGADEVSALHQAQETVKAQYPHPNYWGAFVLVGG